MTSTGLNASEDQDTYMSPRDRSPVRTPSPRKPSGKDHWNQLSPYNLTCCSWNKLLVSSGQWRTGPPTEPGFSQGFFLHSVTDGLCSLPLSPMVSLVGNTSFPAISPTWLHKYYLTWTELDDAITEFNNEMPSTENWVFNLVILHYWHYFPIVQLLWHNLSC